MVEEMYEADEARRCEEEANMSPREARREAEARAALDNEMMSVLYGTQSINVRAADTGEQSANPVEEGNTEVGKVASPLVAKEAEEMTTWSPVAAAGPPSRRQKQTLRLAQP